jgi:hypothetical protein
MGRMYNLMELIGDNVGICQWLLSMIELIRENVDTSVDTSALCRP